MSIYASNYSSVGGVNASILKIQNISSNASINDWNYLVLADTSSATSNLTVILPASISNSIGKSVIIKKVDTSNNAICINPNGTNTIDGNSNVIYLYNKGDCVTITSTANGKCEILPDNRNSTGASNSYLRVSTPASVSLNTTANGVPLVFSTPESNIGNKITYNSNGTIKLKANSTYKLRSSLQYITYSGTEGYFEFQFFDITATPINPLGIRGLAVSVTRGINESKNPTAEATFTPLVDSTISLQIISSTGLTSIYGGFVEVEEVSRQATVISSVDYGYYKWSANQLISTVPMDLVPDIKVCGNIALSAGTFQLKAGKTYSIEWGLYGTWSGTSSVTMGMLCDVTTNTQLTNSLIFDINSIDATSGSYSAQTQNKFIYTPTSDQNVKLRITSSGNNCLIQCDRSWVAITQVGSSACTNVPTSLLGSDVVNAGDVKMTARITAPNGWLICDGSALSRTTYSSLFSAIGTTYGNGDGSTTFNIPDLRGRVPRGFTNINTINGSGTITNNNATFAKHGVNRTGFKLRLQSGTIVGLTTGVTYYAIVIDDNTLAFATTFGNAILNSKISISGTNSGVLVQWEDPDASSRITSDTGSYSNTLGSVQESATKMPNNTFVTNYSGNHTHTFGIAFDTGTDNYTYEAGQTLRTSQSTDPAGNHNHIITGGDNETRMQNIAMNYIIKY